ncbi:HAD family hydrolase [Aestuariicella sp. G3-2]|uniref:HAD hydrolase family protein n=1 Tax=Pseudomaricurvus albidus TaxID=2842452 RepID=UPI001C0C79FB|nr:HAD hydrolase family protein [Aestuariicella albida]MBU3069986.1 HAD family hydrolase [Aestuariicella albida]
MTSLAATALQQRDIRLAFFDIDGTLLGLDGNYTRRVKNAILNVRRAGIKTAVASGRPLFAADFLVDELQLKDAGLFYTGALIFDPSQQKTLELHPLEKGLVTSLIVEARKAGVYTEVCGRDRFFVEGWNDLGKLHSEHLRAVPEQVSFDNILDKEPVIKLLFAVDNAEDQKKLHHLEALFPDTVFAYAKMAAKPDWLFVSVIAQTACKHKGFQQLLDYHQVTAEQVVAFGDAQSDKVFLERAGLGVAMGNAADDVKAVADLVTLPVWEDGVAVVLESILQNI